MHSPYRELEPAGGGSVVVQDDGAKWEGLVAICMRRRSDAERAQRPLTCAPLKK